MKKKYLLFIIGCLLLIPTTLAQSPSCQNNNRAEGLISTPILSGKFGNQISTCVIDPKATFVPFKIPTYDDLKSIYYTQAKSTSSSPSSIQSVEIHYKACATLGGNSSNQARSDLANSIGTFHSGVLTSLTNQCPSYQEFTDTFTTSPTGGAWTINDVNDLQIGVENQGSGGDDRRTTRIWAVVNYGLSNEVLTPTVVSSLPGKNDWILEAGADKVSAVSSDDGNTSYIKRGAIWGGDPNPHYQWFELSNLTGTTLNKTTLTCNPCKQGDIPLTGGSDRLYLVPNDLVIDSNIPVGSQAAVVFVDGNLSISQNVTLGSVNSGLVFVVKGNVNINQFVTRIDAIIIAEGTICTAHDGSSCPSTSITTSQLVINGSLISLAEGSPIKFRRSLSDNTQKPAEKIVLQPKYLVILKDLFADTLQKWSEIQ